MNDPINQKMINGTNITKIAVIIRIFYFFVLPVVIETTSTESKSVILSLCTTREFDLISKNSEFFY